VVGGMHGMVANAAALALYDGEDMHNFAAVVGAHVLCGTFEHAASPPSALDAQRSTLEKRLALTVYSLEIPA
jgi:hypothetical protein